MIFTMNKPSENMLKPVGEIAEMQRQYDAEILKQDEQKRAMAESAVEREYSEYVKEQTDRMREQLNAGRNRRETLSNLKNGLMVECFLKLFAESAVGPMTSHDKTIARRLASNFIKENGVNNLLIDFRTKNVVLSEFARIVNKYYDRAVTESCGEEDGPALGNDVKECNLDQTLVDDFFKDLEDVDTDVVTKMINARVSDAINQFIDYNTAAKMEYQDILQAAKDKVDTNNMTEEAAVSVLNRAKAAVRENKHNRSYSIFHQMVKSLTENAFKNDSLKAQYVNESGAVDMDSIVNDAALIYTMLEICNTTNAVSIDEKYLNEYVSALTA